MSYIDKEKLIKADIASIENRVRHAFNQGYDLGFKDGKGNIPRTHMDILLNELESGEDLDYPCEKCPAAEYCHTQSTTDEDSLCGPIFARWARMEVN